MTAQEFLVATADYIEVHGLSRGGIQDSFGRRCTVSAMGFIERRNVVSKKAIQEAYALVGGAIPATWGIGRWSDTSPPEVVIATLRRLASSDPHEKELVA